MEVRNFDNSITLSKAEHTYTCVPAGEGVAVVDSPGYSGDVE